MIAKSEFSNWLDNLATWQFGNLATFSKNCWTHFHLCQLSIFCNFQFNSPKILTFRKKYWNHFQFWQFPILATFNFGNFQLCQLSILAIFNSNNFQFWLFSSKFFEWVPSTRTTYWLYESCDQKSTYLLYGNHCILWRQWQNLLIMTHIFFLEKALKCFSLFILHFA